MLPREGNLADLLGLLYEGTTDSRAWDLFLGEVANGIGRRIGSLHAG